MSLTRGSGPLSRRPGGAFNFTYDGPAHALYFEDSPRRVRAILEGETVADSTRMKLLHETGLAPAYYFPLEDVRQDLLEPTDHTTHCPFKGDARYWSVRVGDRVAENALWSYPEPLPAAPSLAGYGAFYWQAMDRWLEEDEEVAVHPRDPYQRIDVLASSRHVRLSVDGRTLADSSRPLILFETSLPPRYYLPREDVREDLLVPSDTRTRCPYKGEARYWSVPQAGETGRDLVWCYEEPNPGVGGIAGLLSFHHERLEVVLDGKRHTPDASQP